MVDTRERPGYSGTGRTLWMIWCLAWSVVWLAGSDVLYLLHGPWAVAAAMVPGSLAGIAFPAGKGRRRVP